MNFRRRVNLFRGDEIVAQEAIARRAELHRQDDGEHAVPDQLARHHPCVALECFALHNRSDLSRRCDGDITKHSMYDRRTYIINYCVCVSIRLHGSSTLWPRALDNFYLAQEAL